MREVAARTPPAELLRLVAARLALVDVHQHQVLGMRARGRGGRRPAQVVDMAHAGGAATHVEAARRLLGVLELHHRFLDPLPPWPAGPEGGSAQAGPEDGPSLALAAAIPKLPL